MILQGICPLSDHIKFVKNIPTGTVPNIYVWSNFHISEISEMVRSLKCETTFVNSDYVEILTAEHETPNHAHIFPETVNESGRKK